MSSPQQITDQCERLATHRQNVQTLLKQIDGYGGFIHAPLEKLNTLKEQRGEIAQRKAVLRGWGQVVEDHPDDDATASRSALEQEVGELEEAHATASPIVRRIVEQALQEVTERRKALEPVQATVNIGGNAAVRLAVGVNFGVIVQQFFGRCPPEDGATLLRDYLDALSRECDYLRLSRLTGKRQTGGEQGTAPKLRLQAVHTSLTMDGPQVVVHRRERTARHLLRLLERLDRRRTPENVSPEQVRLIEVTSKTELSMLRERGILLGMNRPALEQSPPDTPCTLWISRSELVLEAIAKHRRLVLLGEPGAGKSTVLRYLTLLLVQRLRDSSASLPGWPVDDLPIPILCPLGRVAAALPAHKGNADKALKQVLGELLEGEQGQSAGLWRHLRAALNGEGVVLLFDGLDELPAEAPEGKESPRVAVARAIQRMEGRTKGRIVVTSRVLPYRAGGDWQFPDEEGWEVRTIQPLAFGQVRTFVQSWYAALADADAELRTEEAQARAAALIGELEESPMMRPLVASPLLLTMLAILHYNKDEVPRDRTKLYEESVQLLLERWEPVRTPGLKRPGLLERLGNVPGLELDLLRGALHELAFQAHDRPPGDDGRGMLTRSDFHWRMLQLFKQVRSPDPLRSVETFEQVLRQDAGLLQARDEDKYAFPHLTFQEYLTACYLANQANMAELVQARWHSGDGERWREVLRLLVGRLRQQEKLQSQALPWLEQLIAERVGKQARPLAERRRDAVLATLVYTELGEAALASSTVNLERRIEAPLREALLTLLAEHDPAIATADRIRAGFLLGELGDPRMPVTLDEWRREVVRMQAGDMSGYFCRVEPGMYWIGSADDDSDADEEERPRHQVTFEQPFWIGHFPITNAQWQLWVETGGEQSLYADDTDLNHPNQPVVGMSWNMAMAFCAWLGGQLGVEVWLPHEAEWEAAARGLEGRRYPWGDEWTEERAATWEDGGMRGWHWSVPVGCYPAGAAGCGALDMVGNVWELTADVWQSYPGVKQPFLEEDGRVLRGGSHRDDRTVVRCMARGRFHLGNYSHDVGLRVLVASRQQ